MNEEFFTNGKPTFFDDAIKLFNKHGISFSMKSDNHIRVDNLNIYGNGTLYLEGIGTKKKVGIPGLKKVLGIKQDKEDTSNDSDVLV